jgi:hypothetical protein
VKDGVAFGEEIGQAAAREVDRCVLERVPVPRPVEVLQLLGAP